MQNLFVRVCETQSSQAPQLLVKDQRQFIAVNGNCKKLVDLGLLMPPMIHDGGEGKNRAVLCHCISFPSSSGAVSFL